MSPLHHWEVLRSHTRDWRAKWILPNNQGRDVLIGQKLTRAVSKQNGLPQKQARETDIL